MSRLKATAVAALAALSVVGCTGGETSSADSKPSAAGARVISVTPDEGSSAVKPGKPVRVRAEQGKLTSVKVTAEGGEGLAGDLSADRESWRSSDDLEYGTTYTVTARATDKNGRKASRKITFTTFTPDSTFVGEYTPERGQTVGVGMPVSITFNKPIPDRSAVERRLRVTAQPAVEGSWSWMKDRDGKDRIDFRPREYWKPGTQVTLRMSLLGVHVGDGMYGTQNRLVRFRVGDAVVSTVDVAKKTMTVTRNGEKLRTLPVSAGKEGFDTWNGTMVVLGKVPTIRMNSDSVGIFGPEAYDLGSVKWDVQLTPSGTYAHAAPWNEGKFGRVNGSHGCIGMSTGDAKWFYDQVKRGDPVTVVNSAETVQANNGFGDWNVPWDEWRAGSALS